MKGFAKKTETSREESVLELVTMENNYEKRKTLKDTLGDAIKQIGLFMVCVAGMIVVCVMTIGNGAYTYNEDTYHGIGNEMLKFAESNKTVSDMKALEEKVGNVYYRYTTKSGTKLVCNRRNGFFNAKVTTYLLDNKADKPELNRNFHSRNEYMLWFWFVFACSVIIGSFMLWLICNCMPYIIRAIYEKSHKLIRKIEEKVNVVKTKRSKSDTQR